MTDRRLDVICLGRASVDLYGEQVGGRLEDMSSFAKYVGGCPANIAVGCARLGLRSALITRVGDEHMGRFIREQLQAEGVDTRGVVTDPERLTALVQLGIRDRERFPMIFFRDNCADMALCEEDIDAEFIALARAVVATGTHLSHPLTEAAVLKALKLARAGGARTALDIDYRPNLWGLAGHGAGEEWCTCGVPMVTSYPPAGAGRRFCGSGPQVRSSPTDRQRAFGVPTRESAFSGTQSWIPGPTPYTEKDGWVALIQWVGRGRCESAAGANRRPIES